MAADHQLDLAASEELNRRIIEAMPAGLVHVRIDGTILRANSEALRVLGLSYDELTARYTQDFAPDTLFEDGSPCSVNDYPVTQALVTGQAQPPMTIGVRRPDRGVSWSIYTAVPVKDPETGATSGAVVTILDITQRKTDEADRRALEARLLFAERMAAVGTLAAGVAHEVNNPLTYVLANLEEARAELPASGDLSGRIDDALEGARRIQHVVAELASFAGGQDDDAPVPLGLVLDASIRLTRNDVRHRARLVTDYDPSLMVAGGKNKLGQLFLNLLINAIQAIPLGDATGHEIRIGARVSGPGRVQVSVRDTGVGIDAAVARSIFEPFVSTKGGATGGGLGLFVCRNIVRDLGGEITVESAPGQGATFTVELPGGPGELPDPPSDPPAASPKRGARSVLIVDDEPVVRRVLSRIFKTWETVEAGGGREALAHIEERSFDAIICDLMMPEMTGMEFFAQVGKTAPALQHRFVFVTGAAFTQEAARFVDTVRRPVLNKPFQRAELVALVEEIAEGQEAGL